MYFTLDDTELGGEKAAIMSFSLLCDGRGHTEGTATDGILLWEMATLANALKELSTDGAQKQGSVLSATWAVRRIDLRGKTNASGNKWWRAIDDVGRKESNFLFMLLGL